MKKRSFSRFFHPLLVLSIWSAWYLYTSPESWQLLQKYWQVTLTMVLGSFIAGATSEGGGAIAFPVFTKLLQVHPHDAKVFSLAIQSIGMTAASFTILLLRIKIDKQFIFWASLGGIPGLLLGTGFVASFLPPTLLRLSFTAMVSSFAITLFILNWKPRNYNDTLSEIGAKQLSILLFSGFCGGIMSGLVGNGIDIICFSVMVLLFRIGEKIATPTSVVLMAINAIVGFIWHTAVIGDFSTEMQNYWLAAVPVVIIGAPLGALFCSKLNNKTIASCLISLIAIELFTSIWLIDFNAQLIIFTITMCSLFTTLYLFMSKSA